MLIREGADNHESEKMRELLYKVVIGGGDDDVEAYFREVHAKLILENVEPFLGNYMRYRVIDGVAAGCAAAPVMEKLVKFLAERKYISKAASRDAKNAIERAMNDYGDGCYDVYDSDTVAKLELETGETLRLIPHDVYLPVILGQAKKLLLEIASVDEWGSSASVGEWTDEWGYSDEEVKWCLPASLAERRALKAVQRISGAIRPLFDAPEGPALCAPDGCVKYPPLHLVELCQADVGMLVAAVESIRLAWGPLSVTGGLGRDRVEIQSLESLLEFGTVSPGWEPMDPYDRLEAVLTLEIDDDMRTLIEVIRTATEDVVLTADQESAYQRVTARLNAALAPTGNQCPRCGWVIDESFDDYSAVADEEICDHCSRAEEQDMAQGRHPAPRDTWPVHCW